ncbi:2428_t:CDS:2 [Gigaspora margarita]|uniref:2428_t:CDS:1 n=1 Tax=Gigaspora margarita TaxID=4874 RepID=A0ABN7UQH5_GIGMA|nr:2428_t:CDS:2 [Gigaspora margarita]
MEFATLGSLYEYLKSNINSMTWEIKIKALYDISLELNHLHDSSLIHQDLHPGNLLSSSNADENFLNIADLGLCKPSDQDPQSNEASVIYGVFPYIAPGITGILPYHNISQDFDLALSIVQGLRPGIPYYKPRSITKLIMECWDARPDKRPTFKVLYQTIKEWYYYIRRNRNSEFTAQIKRAEETTEDSST